MIIFTYGWHRNSSPLLILAVTRVTDEPQWKSGPLRASREGGGSMILVHGTRISHPGFMKSRAKPPSSPGAVRRQPASL